MVNGTSRDELHGALLGEIERLARVGWSRGSLADFPATSRALGISSTDEHQSMADLAHALFQFLVDLKEKTLRATEKSLDATREPGARLVISKQGGHAARSAAALLQLFKFTAETAGAQWWGRLPLTLAARELGIGYEAFRPKAVKGVQVGRIWGLLEFLASELAWETVERQRARTTHDAELRPESSAAEPLQLDEAGGHTGAGVRPATVEIIDVRIEPSTASHGQVLKLHYEINLAAESPLRVWLGASLAPQGGGSWYHDMAHDVEVTLQPGISTYTRLFRIPAAAPFGRFRFVGAAWFGLVGGRALAYYDPGFIVTIRSSARDVSPGAES